MENENTNDNMAMTSLMGSETLRKGNTLLTAFPTSSGTVDQLRTLLLLLFEIQQTGDTRFALRKGDIANRIGLRKDPKRYKKLTAIFDWLYRDLDLFVREQDGGHTRLHLVDSLYYPSNGRSFTITFNNRVKDLLNQTPYTRLSLKYLFDLGSTTGSSKPSSSEKRRGKTSGPATAAMRLYERLEAERYKLTEDNPVIKVMFRECDLRFFLGLYDDPDLLAILEKKGFRKEIVDAFYADKLTQLQRAKLESAKKNKAVLNCVPEDKIVLTDVEVDRVLKSITKKERASVSPRYAQFYSLKRDILGPAVSAISEKTDIIVTMDFSIGVDGERRIAFLVRDNPNIQPVEKIGAEGTEETRGNRNDEKDKKSRKKAARTSTPKGTFYNFEQREYDYAGLEQQILLMQSSDISDSAPLLSGLPYLDDKNDE